MGTEYYLLKPETKVAFELGKGWSIFKDIPFLPFLAETKEELTKIIAEQVYFGSFFDHPAEETHWLKCPKCSEYFSSLASKLFDWCGEDEIQLYSDDDWDLETVLEYEITGSRYVETLLPRCFRPKQTCTKCVFPCKDLMQRRDEMSGIQTFIWADPHLGHRKVMEYENRPFKHIDEHDTTLIKNFNAMVGPLDRVIWVGDCFLTAKERAKSIMEQLNGVHVVVRGNHDHTATQMMALGFHYACERMQIKIAGHDVLICHYPYKTEIDTEHETKYEHLRPKNEGLWLIHGHIHSKGWKFKDKMINVGVDVWDFKPIPLRFFETYIQKKEAENAKRRDNLVQIDRSDAGTLPIL